MDGSPNPTTLTITPEILGLIAEIDEFKGAWRAVGRIAPDRLRRVATIESVGASTRIEGATLTDREVERLLGGIAVTHFATRDEEEVVGYAETLETVFAHHDALDVTENHIRQLHRDLLRHVTKDERHRGDYKTLPNHIEAIGPDGERLGVVFATASPFDTPRRMAALVRWQRETISRAELHPLLATALFVVVFLEIHPFQDGNGRLSRILTTLLLLRAGYAHLPYASLERVIEESKGAYYLALRSTQSTLRTDAPDWQPWVLYFLRALQGHKQRLEAKLERERIMVADLPEVSMRIIDLAREHGRISVGEVAKITGVSRNTVKNHVSALVANGWLTRHGAGRGTWYAPTR